MHLRAVLVVGALVLAIGAGLVAVNLVWSQTQSAPVSTSTLCFDPTYPRLVLQSGTGPRSLMVPEGSSISYVQSLAVLPAESVWTVSTTTPWLLPAPTPPITGPGLFSVDIPGTLAVGHYAGSLDITITGLYKDPQGNPVSTTVPLPVSLEVIPRPIAGPPPPPPPPEGKTVQVDAPSGSTLLVNMRRSSLTDLQVTVNPGQQVIINGVECTTSPGVARRCPVP